MRRGDTWTLPLPESDGWLTALPAVGVVFKMKSRYFIRKWGTGGDPLDDDGGYDTLEAAKFAVELKYG